MVWSHDTRAGGEGEQFHGNALVLPDLVLAGADAEPVGHLYAFERQTGRVRWQRELEGGVPTSLLQSGGLAFGLDMRGDAFAVEFATGQLKWIFRPPSRGHGRTPGDPLLLGEAFVFATRPGEVYSLTAASGKVRWRRDLGTELNTSLASVAGSVVVGASAGKLYELDAASGTVQASLWVGELPFGSLVPFAGCLLGQLAPSTVFCVDRRLRSIGWQCQVAGELSAFRPSLVGGRVLVGTDRGQVVALGAGGAPAWDASVQGVVRSIADFDDTLLVGTLDGRLFAIEAGPRQPVGGREAQLAACFTGEGPSRARDDHP